MTRLSFSLLAFGALLACGGRAVPNDADAGADASDGGDSGPIIECHGYCPQSNGAACSSDCDCYNKCLTGKDTPATCADPIVPAISCGDAAACPSGQHCGVEGTCEGATCANNNQCPPQQQCTIGACAFFGCI